MNLKDLNPEDIKVLDDEPKLEKQDVEDDGIGRDIKDTAMALGEGATLGLGDELLAGLQTGGEAIIGSTKLEDLMSRYRQLQKQNEQAYEQAKERSPILTGVAELAGGFALPGGAIAGATKGLTTGAKVLQAAKMGAGMGALAGFGSSKGDIDTSQGREQLLKDTGLGLGIGAAGGAAGEGLIIGAGKSADALKNWASKNATLANLGESFNIGKAGDSLFSMNTQNKIAKELDSTVSDASKQISKLGDKANEIYDAAINSVKAPQNISKEEKAALESALPLISGKADKALAKKVLGSSDLNEVAKLGGMISDSSVSLRDIKDLERVLSNLRNNETLSRDPRLLEIHELIKDRLQSQMGDNKYAELQKLFASQRQPHENFLQKAITESSPEFKNVDIEKLSKGLETATKYIYNPTSAGVEGRVNFNRYIDELKTLLKEQPELAGKLDLDDIAKNLSSQSKKFNAMEMVTGKKQGEGLGKIESSLTANITGGGANIAGNISYGLSKATDATLGNVARVLKGKPGLNHLGNALESALNNKSQAAKNAVIFSLSQKPEARDLLKDVLPTNENKE